MDALDPTEETDVDADREECPAICVQRSRPDRTVFTEEGNPDGWIGTDLTVDVDR